MPELDPLLNVARDLAEIVDLHAALGAEAVAKAGDPAMPGGVAMVMLGPDASLEAWGNIIDARDAHGRDTSHVDDHDPDWEPPLQTLLWWSEQWRVEHEAVTDLRPTIATEARFLVRVLAWAYEHEPRWDDFTADVAQARRRLENALREGEQVDRSQVPCVQPTCERRPRLVKIYTDRADQDHYQCPACKHRYDSDAFTRAHAKHLRSEGAERYVRVADARATLRGLGRSERTIRKWFADGLVGGYCNTATREVWCWWPDLWQLHLSTATRRRAA